MSEPTEAQIKEFWEWYRLPYEGYGNVDRLKAKSLPPIDLNNLFKYAVPKECEIHFYKDKSAQDINCIITLPNEREFDGTGDTYALALFWALDKVREMSK